MYDQIDFSLCQLEGHTFPGVERNHTVDEFLNVHLNHVLPQHPESRGDAAKYDAFDVAEIAACTRGLKFVIYVLSLAALPTNVFFADCVMLRQWLLACNDNALFVLGQTDQGFVIIEILTVFVEGVVVFEALDRCFLKSQLDLRDVHFFLLS